MIYLDNAATTIVKPEVADVIIKTMIDDWGNPSSVYNKGLESKRLINHAREIIAESINAELDEIIFTSGSSESNALAISGYCDYYGAIALASAIEHSSILKNKHVVNTINVNEDGNVDISDLYFKLHRYDYINPILITTMLANNEIGSINDIHEISKCVHDNNGILHVDATQGFSHIPIDVKRMKIDMMSVSGHKFGTPKGIGFLYKKKDLNLRPIIPGNQENGTRGGTENVPYIVGLGKAIELIDYSEESKIKSTRNYIIKSLNELNINYKINGSTIYRLANNLSITIPKCDAQQLIAFMDLQNICISAGSACCSGESKPSYVLKAIGLSDEEAKNTIRVTVDSSTTEEEIDSFVKVLYQYITQFIE